MKKEHLPAILLFGGLWRSGWAMLYRVSRGSSNALNNSL